MTETLKLRVKKAHSKAQIPTYGTAGAACFDLYSVEHGRVDPKREQVFRTGLHFEVPAGHVMLCYSRSGHGFKHGVRLVNCVGVVDSDYRGEVHVGLANDNAVFGFEVAAGDRIAQAMVVPVGRVEFEDVGDAELASTARGDGGYGSTGR